MYFNSFKIIIVSPHRSKAHGGEQNIGEESLAILENKYEIAGGKDSVIFYVGIQNQQNLDI